MDDIVAKKKPPSVRLEQPRQRPTRSEAEAAVVDRPVLTPQERRITRLVVQGRTNAEIAEELSLARRTVEFHLSGVYRKLGISGRRELVEWRGAEVD